MNGTFFICCVLAVIDAPLYSLFDTYAAQRAYKDGQHDLAYQKYAQAAVTQGDAQALYNMGVIAYQKKEYTTAEQCFCKAAESQQLSHKQKAELEHNVQKTREKLKEQQEQQKKHDDNSKPDEPTKQSDAQKDGHSDSHEQQQDEQGKDDHDAKNDEQEKESSKSDTQEQRENKSKGREKQADEGEQGQSEQSQDKDPLNDMLHDDAKSNKDATDMTDSQDTRNKPSVQKRSLDNRLTETDKKLVALIDALDEQSQKQFMKALMKQQPVVHGQKHW